MSDAREDKRSRRAWELARRQHGVVARRQLLALGFSKRAIEHRIESGRLHPVMQGVYAVGWPTLTQERRWIAATLACADGAALSHRSAAALWRIGKERTGRIDVSIRRRSRLVRAGLCIRSRPSLADDSVVIRDGIAVTDPVQTLLDIATELPSLQVERAVNEADKRDLIDPETLRKKLARRAGQPGVPMLRDLLDRHTFRLSDSELEIVFRPIAVAAGLPVPLTKQRVNGFEVDFFWPDLGLVVETDGWHYHRTPSSQSRDARRDRAHVLAGMMPLRFTHYEIKYERPRVHRALERAAARLM